MSIFLPESLLSDLLEKLERFNDKASTDTNQILQCAEISALALQQLNDYLPQEKFDTDDIEIAVFKRIKPQIEGRLIFYLKLLAIEQLAPPVGDKHYFDYFNKHASKVQQWLHRHEDAYLYFKLNATYHDSVYFIRQRELGMSSRDAILAMTNHQVQTAWSYLFAQFIAADLLLRHHRIRSAPTADTEMPTQLPEEPLLIWTGSLADLTELLYALNELGVLDGRRQEIQKVKVFFEKIFNVSMGNIYKTYEHNRLRKKSRTPFLDNARLALLRRYDHDDEHAM